MIFVRRQEKLTAVSKLYFPIFNVLSCPVLFDVVVSFVFDAEVAVMYFVLSSLMCRPRSPPGHRPLDLDESSL